MKIEWSPAARASARRYLSDQPGLRAIGEAVAALALAPHPQMLSTKANITAYAWAGTELFT